MDQFYSYLFLYAILFYNLIILYTKVKFWKLKINSLNDFINNVKLFRTN